MSSLGWSFLYFMFVIFYVVTCVDMYFDFGVKFYNLGPFWSAGTSFFNLKF
uniref:Atp8 n=1 Tax=Trialeurodes vaporariorum TaxID=88556 RepID=Q674N7_TRIVP|nr:ATP synthase F0 subunit 8 [Trialeurodes vaporariorum]AAU14223.1 atp8 [Trialeurodes vaporariorum]